MTLTARYRQLKKRIQQLDRRLPGTSATGAYSEAEYDMVRAYRLLAHAEIEAYVEDAALASATEATQAWIRTGKPQFCTVHLMLFDDHENLSQSWTSSNYQFRVQKLLDRYRESIKNNHGIKARNILKMLLPLGIRERELSPTWLATMNSFGQERGEVAHSAMAVQTPPDPVTEKTRVHQILKDLTVVDRKLTSARGKGFSASLFGRLEPVSFGLSQVRQRR